jgi:hypothetical protein
MDELVSKLQLGQLQPDDGCRWGWGMKLFLRTVQGGAAASILFSGSVAAQSVRGSMGPDSRATIRISVSVMPRLDVESPGPADAVGPKSGGEAYLRSSNMPGLRYSLLELDPSPALGGNGGHLKVKPSAIMPDPRLVLVVPD